MCLTRYMKPTRDEISNASAEQLHSYWRTASGAIDELEQALEDLPTLRYNITHHNLRSWWFQILMLNDEIQARKSRHEWWCVCEICFEPFPR